MGIKDLFKSREDLINEGVATSFVAMGTDNQGTHDKYFLRTYYESLPSKSSIRHDIQMVHSEVSQGLFCDQCGCINSPCIHMGES